MASKKSMPYTFTLCHEHLKFLQNFSDWWYDLTSLDFSILNQSSNFDNVELKLKTFNKTYIVRNVCKNGRLWQLVPQYRQP